MYIETVPNRNSPPAILLREGWREGGKVKKRTLANLSKWPKAKIDALRRVLKNEPLVGREEAFDIVRSRPHGHVAAVLGTLKQLHLDRLIAPQRSPERDRAVAMIVARVLDPGSRFATARNLADATAGDSLADTVGLGAVNENDLYAAMDWLLKRQDRIERALARRHLEEGALVLYDLTSVFHRNEERVRAHVLLCMLAYYVEWHMRKRLAPLLFDDEDRAGAEAARTSVAAPVQVSESARRKARRKRSDEGRPVHSFRTLLRDLATVTRNRVAPRLPGAEPFDLLTRPTDLQREAFRLLGVRLR